MSIDELQRQAQRLSAVLSEKQAEHGQLMAQVAAAPVLAWKVAQLAGEIDVLTAAKRAHDVRLAEERRRATARQRSASSVASQQ